MGRLRRVDLHRRGLWHHLSPTHAHSRESMKNIPVLYFLFAFSPFLPLLHSTEERAKRRKEGLKQKTRNPFPKMKKSRAPKAKRTACIVISVFCYNVSCLVSFVYISLRISPIHSTALPILEVDAGPVLRVGG